MSRNHFLKIKWIIEQLALVGQSVCSPHTLFSLFSSPLGFKTSFYLPGSFIEMTIDHMGLVAKQLITGRIYLEARAMLKLEVRKIYNTGSQPENVFQQ